MPAQILLDTAEEIDAGALFPVAVSRGILAAGDGIILVEAAEMVDAGHIIELEDVPQAAEPPAVFRQEGLVFGIL